MPLLTTSRGPAHWIESAAEDAAPAVLLLHGLGGDAAFWSAELAALGGRFRVLAVDLRGSGRTPGSAAPFSIEDLAEDVLAVLDQARVESAHVVGFSMGGTVAQALAAAAPTRVRSLVLAATFARMSTQARLFLRAVASVYQADATPKQMFELILPWLFSEDFLGGPHVAPYLDYPEDAAGEQSRHDWLALLEALLAFDGHAALQAIQAPTLVLHGDQDRLASGQDGAGAGAWHPWRGAVRAGRRAPVQCRTPCGVSGSPGRILPRDRCRGGPDTGAGGMNRFL